MSRRGARWSTIYYNPWSMVRHLAHRSWRGACSVPIDARGRVVAPYVDDAGPAPEMIVTACSQVVHGFLAGEAAYRAWMDEFERLNGTPRGYGHGNPYHFQLRDCKRCFHQPKG